MMLNWKGIFVGTLVYVAVDLIVTFVPGMMRPTPPEFARAHGVMGFDLVTYFHNINVPMFLIGVLVFWSLASRLFQHS